MLDDLDLSGITDERARTLIVRLLNLLETVSSDLRSAQEEIQRLRDENNRLKGEQAKPSIKPNKPPQAPDHSSENERRRPVQRGKRSKRDTIKIDREQTLRVDPSTLPTDALSSRAMTRSSFRTSRYAPIMSCSAKKSSTPAPPIVVIALPCPMATLESSAPASKPSRWYCTLAA